MLGLDPDPAWDDVVSKGIVSSKMTELEIEMIEDMLPETEWLGRTVAVLEASLDTNESGLGINSRVSENPTLPLVKDFLGVGTASIDIAGGIGASSGVTCSVWSRAGVSACGFGLSRRGGGKENCLFNSGPDGLDGALFPLDGSAGFFGRLRPSTALRSWLDMAAERR